MVHTAASVCQWWGVNGRGWGAYQADGYVVYDVEPLDYFWSCTERGKWRNIHHTPTLSLVHSANNLGSKKVSNSLQNMMHIIFEKCTENCNLSRSASLQINKAAVVSNGLILARGEMSKPELPGGTHTRISFWSCAKSKLDNNKWLPHTVYSSLEIFIYI